MVKFYDTQGDPLISVYIPTFNRCDLLQTAVASVLRQSFENFEVIVVDDRSDDSTFDYLQQQARRDPRLRYAKLARKSGAPAARNHALSLARGEFITGLDDDDEFLPTRLEGLLNYWRTKSIGSDVFSVVFTDSYIETGKLTIPTTDRKDVACHDDLFEHNYIGNQFFTLTSRLRQIGGFDISMPAWQDLELLLRMTKTFGPAFRAPQRSYIQRVDLRNDRISAGSDNVGRACALVSEKHAGDNRRRRELLFMQSFSLFYKRTPTLADWKVAARLLNRPEIAFALLRSSVSANFI